MNHLRSFLLEVRKNLYTNCKSKVITIAISDQDQDEFKEVTDREATSYSTETTTSWLREANMDADIYTYAKAKLLRRDEYFFRIWYYADELFK